MITTRSRVIVGGMREPATTIIAPIVISDHLCLVALERQHTLLDYHQNSVGECKSMHWFLSILFVLWGIIITYQNRPDAYNPLTPAPRIDARLEFFYPDRVSPLISRFFKISVLMLLVHRLLEFFSKSEYFVHASTD